MEPITAVLGTVVGYLAKKLRDSQAVKDFSNEFSEATVKWIKPLFLKEDDSPKEVLKNLQEKPESPARQKAAVSALEVALEDKPEAEQWLREMYDQIDKQAGGVGQYHIDNRGANIGQQNIGSTVHNKDNKNEFH